MWFLEQYICTPKQLICPVMNEIAGSVGMQCVSLLRAALSALIMTNALHIEDLGTTNIQHLGVERAVEQKSLFSETAAQLKSA